MRLYTGRGDDGTTGLFRGGRVSKDDTGPEAYGTVDEAVSALGVARATAAPEVGDRLLALQRDLFVAAAELATAVGGRQHLEPGVSLVTAAMVESLEDGIDTLVAEAGLPEGFVVAGGDRTAAAIDLARAIVRRAERRSVTHLSASAIEGSLVVPFLNRLADHLYALARAVEGDWTPSREA